MQWKKSALFISLVVLLFVVGCQNQGKAGKEPVGKVWFGGDKGLQASFELEATEVYEDESFPLTILLENKGEYTLYPHEVVLEVQGISPSDFSGIDFLTDNNEQVDKVSEFLPDGGYELVNLGDALYQGLSGTFYDANIYIQYTYPYATFVAIPKVCFKGDLRDQRICNVEETKDAFASGAPIQTGIVKERAAGSGSVYLEIPVYNKGTGRAKAFVNDEFSNLFDEVRFEVNTAGFSCTARGDPQVVRIPRNQQTGETFIRCKSDHIEPGKVYTKQIDLTLSYYYQDLISQRVRIKQNPELVQ